MHPVDLSEKFSLFSDHWHPRIVGELNGLNKWPILIGGGPALKQGAVPVPPDHPDFYENYTAVGRFPGLSVIDAKVLLTRLVKTFGGVADSLL